MLSHEVLEADADPNVNLWADGPTEAAAPGETGSTPGLTYAREVCDPVEATSYIIELPDGTKVSVSDFILPAWFDAGDTVGPWSFCKAAPSAFGLAPGGYAVTRTGGPGTEQQIEAEGRLAWRRAMKAANRDSRTRRRDALRQGLKGSGSLMAALGLSNP